TTRSVRCGEARKNASLALERKMVAKNATWPFVFAGATIGSASTPKCSNVPPPGAGSPAIATARTEDCARAPATLMLRRSTLNTGARPCARMAGEYRHPGPHDNDAVRDRYDAARGARRRRRQPGGARVPLRARRRLLLPGGG